MTNKEKVEQVYPKATITLHGIFSDRVIVVIPPFNTEMDGFWGIHLSDHFSTDEEAWADAWSKIQAQRVQVAREEE